MRHLLLRTDLETMCWVSPFLPLLPPPLPPRSPLPQKDPPLEHSPVVQAAPFVPRCVVSEEYEDVCEVCVCEV